MKNNEIIVKAKFEYYENEMAKKEREILELLDLKKVNFSNFNKILHNERQLTDKLE